MDGSTSLLLAGQAALALAGALAMRRRVLPALEHTRYPTLVTDVWGPLVIAGPLLFHAAPLTDTVRGTGWIPLGGPVLLGVLGLGIGLVRGGARESAVPLGTASIWAGAGLVLLLLGAAHDLSVAVGQCAFALSAVLLWCNTPVPEPFADAESRAGPALPAGQMVSAGTALLLAIACAIGQGVMTLWVPAGAGRLISASIAIAYGASVLLAGRRASPQSAIRIGGWTAGLGLMLGLGVLSMLRLVPMVLLMVRDRSELSPGIVRVAYGFGSLAPEATLLLAAAAAVATLGRAGTGMRRAIGAVLAVLAVGLLAVRGVAMILTHDIL